MKDFKNTILEKIEKGEIKQKSKNIFIAKNISFWFLVAISLLAGSLSFSSILFGIMENFGPLHKLAFKTDSFFLYFITLPYIWIFLLILFVSLTYITFRKTDHGYKKNIFTIISFSLILSFLLGIAFFKFGFGEIMEDRFKKNIPIYKNHIEKRKEDFRGRLEKKGIDPEEFIKNKKVKDIIRDNRKELENILKENEKKIKPSSFPNENPSQILPSKNI